MSKPKTFVEEWTTWAATGDDEVLRAYHKGLDKLTDAARQYMESGILTNGVTADEAAFSVFLLEGTKASVKQKREAIAAMNRLVSLMARGERVHPVIRSTFAFIGDGSGWFSLTLNWGRGRPATDGEDMIVEALLQQRENGASWPAAIGGVAQQCNKSKERIRQIARENKMRRARRRKRKLNRRS